jgi:hypothetical protein
MTSIVSRVRKAIREPPFPEPKEKTEPPGPASPDIMPYIYEFVLYVVWEDIWSYYYHLKSHSSCFQVNIINILRGLVLFTFTRNLCKKNFKFL